jgi:TonB family protein
MTFCLLLVIASSIATRARPQDSQEKDKAPQQEKKPEDKKPDTAAKGGIEILSDTMGVDFRPYMKLLKFTVQGHWDALIPQSALPPLMKSGTVVIEFAIKKNGQIVGMKLAKSSGDIALDRAAWGSILDSVPLPTLPSAFKGDFLRLRCNFIYNPATKPAPLANPEPK